MQAEYDLLIRIDPCQIDSYEATQTITVLTYTLGEPDLVSSSYRFGETPVCDYPETITVAGLPGFASHQDLSKTFLIE